MIRADRYLPSTAVSSWLNYTNQFRENRTPPVTSGLVGLYDTQSWTGTQWSDISGTGNHVTNITGTVSTVNVSGNGSSLTIPALQGNTSTVVRWPTATILPATYTLFHVTRYTGGTRQRILTGSNNNWLSGHWSGTTGVAFHEGWLTPQTDIHGNNWFISTDQNSLYRSNGVTRGSSGGSASTQLTINHNEASDWNITFVAVYNRTLSLAEYQQVESWLSSRYGIAI